MVNLLNFTLLFLFSFSGVYAQEMDDRMAVLKILEGQNIDGKYLWRPADYLLKSIAYEVINEGKSKKTNTGLLLISNVLTSANYDDYYDPLFLKVIMSRDVRIDSLFVGADYLRYHFRKSDYDSASLNKLAFYSEEGSILYWKSWTPYYLSFLDAKGLNSALFFLKEHIDVINDIRYKMDGVSNRFEEIDVDICLVRIGEINDTLIVDMLEEKFSKRNEINTSAYVSYLSMIRTPYSFRKIGEVLISGDFDSNNNSGKIALAAFLIYVSNFPDRSTKSQDVFDKWNIVTYSKMFGKDYNTKQYLAMAKRWFLENSNNLVLDKDKY